MTRIFECNQCFARSNLCSPNVYKPFLESGFNLDEVSAKYGNFFLSEAEKIADKSFPELTASMYMEYTKSGNRSIFESAYFGRRNMTITFLLAELCENKGRFTDKLIDGIWHILEESTWVIPAHNEPNKQGSSAILPDAFFTNDDDDFVKHIDLFSAATGSTIAWIYYFAKDILDKKTPIISNRMLSQLKHRILHPFYSYNHDWWMGITRKNLINWTPWIISNVLPVIAICENDMKKREDGMQKCMDILDRYTICYSPDGACDEGANYWSASAGCYFDCLEQLYDISGGKINLFDNEFVNKMCSSITDYVISDNLYINFADASPRVGQDYRMIYRMGERLHSSLLKGFANSVKNDSMGISSFYLYRFFKNLTVNETENIPFVPRDKAWYPNLQIAVSRDLKNGLFLAIKGGHNNEGGHNHNDTGSFILYQNTTPVIIDAGVGEYRKETFNSQRYTIWTMQGGYHNLPVINAIEQMVGENYHAKVKEYNESTGRLILDLTEAYPLDAEISSYEREAFLENGVMILRDNLSLKNSHFVEFHFLTLDEPSLCENSVVFKSGQRMEFDPSLTYSSEPVFLDKKLSSQWGSDCLYRIKLSCNIKNKIFTFKVFPA